MSKHKPGERIRYSTWLSKDTLQLIEKNYLEDDCFTKGEYIEKAVDFYSNYLEEKDASKFIPKILISSLRGVLDANTERQNKLLFKIAVELAILSNVIAAVEEIPLEEINKLRGECIKEVKSTNGIMNFEKAKGWQGD